MNEAARVGDPIAHTSVLSDLLKGFSSLVLVGWRRLLLLVRVPH